MTQRHNSLGAVQHVDSPTSRGLMYGQLIVVLLPVTLIELVFATLVAELFTLKGSSLWLFAGPVAIVLAPLVALWGLAIVYAFRGAAQLRSLGPAWWFLATAGAGIPAMGISAYLVDSTLGGTLKSVSDAFIMGKDDDPFGIAYSAASAVWALKYGAWTTPILITLTHLWRVRSRLQPL